MIIGVPKEIKINESRVSLVPSGAEELVSFGHTVLIEKSAGIGSGFSDKMYIESGAHIINTAKEVFDRSEMILKVKEPQKEEYSLIRKDQIIFTFCC